MARRYTLSPFAPFAPFVGVIINKPAYQGVATLIQSKPILETNQVEDWRWSIEQKTNE